MSHETSASTYRSRLRGSGVVMMQRSRDVGRGAVTRVFRLPVLKDVSAKSDRLRAAMTFLLIAPLNH